jgi:GTPase SAR1 family protein
MMIAVSLPVGKRLLFKIIMQGNSGVGKTSVMNRYCTLSVCFPTYL